MIRHFDDAAGIVGDGPEGVHGEDVGRRRKHAHGGNGRSVNAFGVVGDRGISQPAYAEVVTEQQGGADHDHRHGGGLHTHGEPADDVGCGAGERGVGDRLHRPVAGLGVVLGDADKEKRGNDADYAAAQQPPAALQHVVHRPGKAGQRQQGSDVIAAVQRIHRVLIFAAMDHQHADEAGDQVDGVHDQGKENALDAENRIEGRAQDHGADVFRGRGFEDVRATAGAVAHVVTDQVGDDGGIPRIVFRDAGLHLAHQVSADVGSLGVDAAAKLGKERHQRRAKTKPDQLVGNVLRVLQSAKEVEQAADPEQGEADDHQAGNGAAVQGNLQGAAQAGPGGAGGADVGPDGDEHARVTGEPRADRADQKADDHLAGQRGGKVRKLVAHKESDGQHHGQGGDGGVLARHKGFRALADGVRDDLHFRGAGIVRKDRLGKKKSKNQAEEAGNESNPEKSAATSVERQRSSPVLRQWPIERRKPFHCLQRKLTAGVIAVSQLVWTDARSLFVVFSQGRPLIATFVRPQ